MKNKFLPLVIYMFALLFSSQSMGEQVQNGTVTSLNGDNTVATASVNSKEIKTKVSNTNSSKDGNSSEPGANSMLVRISEIDIFPQYLDQYMKAALTVGADSVANEKGVICIFPMVQKRDNTKIRIIEIYSDMDAYRHHIKTPWFQTYKQSTLHMVKHLDLVDMQPMNPSAMPAIFRKM